MVIIFSKLGAYGRLGNQMFQFAALKSIAKKNGYVYKIPPGNYSIKNLNLKAEQFTFKDLKKINKCYTEKSFCYDGKAFSINDWTDISGYFQSYKYFESIKEELRQEFVCKIRFENKANEILKSFGNVVGVHVRRMDYLLYPKIHPFPGEKYYTTAINWFRKQGKYTYIVCSDDIKWCKENIIGNDIYYSENNEYIDLAILYKSKHNIVANSSLSWWGAWLNQNKDKIVIYPKQWFGPNGPDWIDLVPKAWIKR